MKSEKKPKINIEPSRIKKKLDKHQRMSVLIASPKQLEAKRTCIKTKKI